MSTLYKLHKIIQNKTDRLYVYYVIERISDRTFATQMASVFYKGQRNEHMSNEDFAHLDFFSDFILNQGTRWFPSVQEAVAEYDLKFDN